MVDVAVATPGPWVPEDTFANRLIQTRRHVKLTQEEAAALCGVNSKTWNTWEHGTKPQGMNEVVRKIHKGLGVDPGWLMWGAQSRAALSETSRKAGRGALSLASSREKPDARFKETVDSPILVLQ